MRCAGVGSGGRSRIVKTCVIHSGKLRYIVNSEKRWREMEVLDPIPHIITDTGNVFQIGLYSNTIEAGDKC